MALILNLKALIIVIYPISVIFFFIQDSCGNKNILLISCRNFRFFFFDSQSFFYILDSGFFNQTSCYAKMFFLLHFSIMLRRWFDDQDFVLVFNFFLMLEKSWKYGKHLFACFVDRITEFLSNFGGFCN